MTKIIEYVIGAKDATGSAIKSALAKVRDFASAVGRNLTNIKSGFEMVAGTVQRFSGIFIKAINEAFKMEKAYANFTGLLNSIDKAKEHVADLQKFASVTPLTFDDLSQASRLLLSFGASVDSIMPSLKMIGDIAMGDKQKFQGLALVFAQVKSAGKLMGQDLLQMINQGFNPLTVMAEKSGKSMSELKDLMSKGAISFDMVAEAMRVATSEGGLFCNAMDNAAKTGEGLLSTLQDNWADALRTFGTELMDVAKGGIQWCINKLKELKESGTITEWAKKAKSAIYAVMGAFRGLADESTRSTAFGAIRDVVVGGFEEAAEKAITLLKKAAPVIGALIADGFSSLKDIMADMMSESAAKIAAEQQLGDKLYHTEKGLTPNAMGQLIPYEKKVRNADADQMVNELAGQIMEEQKRQKAEEIKMRAEEMSGRFTDERRPGESRFERGMRVLQSLGQRLQAEMTSVDDTPVSADQKAKMEMKSKGDLATMVKNANAEDEKERAKIEKAIAKEREKQWKAYVAMVKKDAQDLAKEQTAAEKLLSDANAKEKEAWGWYRDKDSLKAKIADEQANAQAEIQFQKEFEKLKSRRYDWRTANEYGSGGMHALSLDETAVKRVALAREEQANAQEYARQTAEASQAAADALEQINQVIQEGA